jgi:hypothetical protein
MKLSQIFFLFKFANFALPLILAYWMARFVYQAGGGGGWGSEGKGAGRVGGGDRSQAVPIIRLGLMTPHSFYICMALRLRRLMSLLVCLYSINVSIIVLSIHSYFEFRLDNKGNCVFMKIFPYLRKPFFSQKATIKVFVVD